MQIPKEVKIDISLIRTDFENALLHNINRDKFTLFGLSIDSWVIIKYEDSYLTLRRIA